MNLIEKTLKSNMNERIQGYHSRLNDLKNMEPDDARKIAERYFTSCYASLGLIDNLDGFEVQMAELHKLSAQFISYTIKKGDE